MATGALIEALPEPSRWDFGGYPYGLEPLTLPDPATSHADRETARDEGASDDLRTCDLSLRNLEPILRGLRALDLAAGSALPLRPDPVERLFWFRWITGHQTTFILWQLLAQAVRRGTGNDLALADQERCRVLVRGYSTMLLYTGSCPRTVYHRIIRPSMVLYHPGFSGSWARDFGPVRRLLRVDDERSDTPLGRERALNVSIHDGIAEKLVPTGQSLLKTAASQEDVTWRRSVLAVLYDMYFLTLRAPVPAEIVVRQLIRRLHAIGWDIASNGLYPAGASSAAERPASLRTALAEECEQTILDTLFAIATQVAGDLRTREQQ